MSENLFMISVNPGKFKKDTQKCNRDISVAPKILMILIEKCEYQVVSLLKIYCIYYNLVCASVEYIC